MSWLALGLLCLFLAIIFPLRAARQRALFGLRRRPRPARRRPAAWAAADLIVLAGFALAVAGPALAGIGVHSMQARGSTAMQVAGTVMLLAAIVLAAWAQETLGRSWRLDIRPDAAAGLVTTGPYTLVRNPSYVAMLAAAAGSLLLVPGAAGLAGLVVLLAGLMLTARYEEPQLEAAFGDAYRAYMARAGRFVPGIGRRRARR